jgi:uncharacterized OsmC-like protein
MMRASHRRSQAFVQPKEIDMTNSAELKARQAPLKDQYRANPTSALKTLRAEAELVPNSLDCAVDTFLGPTLAGLHPAAGGDGSTACSGDMLLQSLVACAGVTLQAVALAMGIPLRGGKLFAEADLDFRGTLGVDRTTPVGFTAIRLVFELQTDAPDDQVAKLVQLVDRYCVIAQTLQNPPAFDISHRSATGSAQPTNGQ